MKYTIKKHQNGKGTIVIFETDDRNEALVNYKEECEKAQEERKKLGIKERIRIELFRFDYEIAHCNFDAVFKDDGTIKVVTSEMIKHDYLSNNPRKVEE